VADEFPARAVIAAFCVFLSVRFLYILTGGIDRILAFVPDDAFYYFVSADNFARLGQWTFDGGISRTTGFHLLHGYLLAAFSLPFHGVPGMAIVYFAIGLTFVCGLAGAVLIVRLVRGLFGDVAAVAALLPLLSYAYLLGSCSGMEWGAVLLAACLVFAALYRLGDRPLSRRDGALLVLLGLILELGRSDAGVLAAALCAGAILVGFVRPNRSFTIAAGLVLAGAVAGLAITLIHTDLVSGQLISGSARIKALWSQRGGGFGLRAGYRLLLITIGLPQNVYGARAIVVLAPFAVITAIVARPFLAGWRAKLRDADLAILNLLAGSLLALVAFTIVYGFNSAATQFWYSSTIIVPVCVLFGGWAALVARYGNRLARSAALVLWGGLIASAVYAAFVPPWTYQTYFRAAGLYAARELPDQRIGCWNCGITGFFRDGPTVNLDGLMNDDVYPFVAGNDLAGYIKSRDIHYLLDFSMSVESPGAQRHGGYDSPAFRAMLHPAQVLSPTQPSYQDSRMTLYRLGD
jgi:hypothetical protein